MSHFLAALPNSGRALRPSAWRGRLRHPAPHRDHPDPAPAARQQRLRLAPRPERRRRARPAALWPAVGRLPEEPGDPHRSEEHKSELQSLMRIQYAVIILKNNNIYKQYTT